MNSYFSWAWIFGAAFGTGAANILIKYARTAVLGSGPKALLLSPYFLCGLCCYGLSLICFTKGLDKVPISSAYPVQSGLAFVLVTVMSYFLLSEPIYLGKIAGLFLILCGIIVVIRYT